MIDWQHTLKCMRATLYILEMFSVRHAKCEYIVGEIKANKTVLTVPGCRHLYWSLHSGVWLLSTQAEDKPFITKSTDDGFLHSSKVNTIVLWSCNNQNSLTAKWPEYWNTICSVIFYQTLAQTQQSVNIIKKSICLMFCTAVTSDPSKQALSRYV